MRHLIPFLFLLACAPVPLATRGAEDPLVYDSAAVESAGKLAILIPGALTSVEIFAATAAWEDHGFARASYRYPGLDDLPVDHRVAPEAAAARIAAFANRYPDKPVTLVGYSTGGPIALLAASQIEGDRPVRVAAMSTAVDYGGGVETFLRGLGDVLRAIDATGSIDRAAVWKRFWSGLLYGPDAFDDPSFATRLADKVAEGEDIYVELNIRMALAHTLSLPAWRLPDDLDLDGVDIAFFIGLRDPVFATGQTLRFARRFDGATVYGYPDDGHLLFFTRPDVFRDIRTFAEGQAVTTRPDAGAEAAN